MMTTFEEKLLKAVNQLLDLHRRLPRDRSEQRAREYAESVVKEVEGRA